MSGRALITGAGGFVGKHLREHLLRCGWEVVGCDIVPQPGVQVCNLLDREQTEAFIQGLGPITHVFHLSAISFVPQSVESPLACFQTNTESVIVLTGLLNKYYGDKVHFLFVSTSEVYGQPKYLPMDEQHPLNPQNPYAISKLASDLYCQFLHKRGSLRTTILRPFNHSGAGQNERFVLSNFAKQFVEMKKGLREHVLHVGNIEVERDFSHVADVVRAYELIAKKEGEGEVYNVCKGHAYSLKQVIEILQQITGIEVRICVDPERLRATDTPRIYGSCEKLKRAISWEPKYDLDDILRDLVEYWMGKESSS